MQYIYILYYIYTYIYTCIYTCIYTYIYLHACLHIYTIHIIHISTSVYDSICIPIHLTVYL